MYLSYMVFGKFVMVMICKQHSYIVGSCIRVGTHPEISLLIHLFFTDKKMYENSCSTRYKSINERL